MAYNLLEPFFFFCKLKKNEVKSNSFDRKKKRNKNKTFRSHVEYEKVSNVLHSI